jgi:hypothetical protein
LSPVGTQELVIPLPSKKHAESARGRMEPESSFPEHVLVIVEERLVGAQDFCLAVPNVVSAARACPRLHRRGGHSPWPHRFD